MSVVNVTRRALVGEGPSGDAVTLNVHVVYNGAPDTRIRNRGLCAHVWTDAVRIPQLDEGFESSEDLWHTLDLERSAVGNVRISRNGAKHVYVAVFDNRAADYEGGAQAVAVQGERRAFAVFDANPILAGSTVLAHLMVPEAGGISLGTVRIWTGAAPSKPIQSSYSSAFADAMRFGEELARTSRAIDGVPGITEGMRHLDTKYWNNRRTSLPGWIWILNMPKLPENPRFIEAIVRAAADRRGFTDIESLARATTQSVKGGASRPSRETLDFAMIVAEAYHIAVTTARYLTDQYDKNVSGKPWRSYNLDPVELMTANIREDRADDCEGFAAGIASLMYGTAHGEDCGNLLYDATRCIVRCWLPIVSLGQSSRNGEGAQYNTGDNMNAHSWLMLIPTSAARVAMASGSHETLSAVLDRKVMLDPWEQGLPVLILDGTTTFEHTARSWLRRDSTSCSLRGVCTSCPFASVVRTLDPNFHRVLRNGYTPYGVVSARDPGRRVFEVYWYTGSGRAQRYGVPVWDVHRLPQTVHHGFSSELPPVSEYSSSYWVGGKRPNVWLAASSTVSLDDLKRLRPAIAQMHPVRPAPFDPTGGDAGARLLRSVISALRSKGVAVAERRRAPASENAWGSIPNVIALRYADASDPENIEALAESLRPFRVAVELRPFWLEEPQIWIFNA